MRKICLVNLHQARHEFNNAQLHTYNNKKNILNEIYNIPFQVEKFN